MKRMRLIRRRMPVRSRKVIGKIAQTRWVPVALAWGKPRRALPALRLARAQVASFHKWAPQLHLHLAVPAITSRPRLPGTMHPGKTSSIVWRKFDTRVFRRLPVERDVELLTQHGPAERSADRALTRFNRLRETEWHRFERIFRKGALPSRPAADRHTAKPMRLNEPRQRLARAIDFTWLPRLRRSVAAVRTEIRSPQLVLHSARTIAPLSSNDRGSERPLRTPDMVWRRQAEGAPGGAMELSASGPGPFATATSFPSAPKSWQSSETADAVRPQLLDSALMDRVAEDVMGRVEKRIRIERERRGV